MESSTTIQHSVLCTLVFLRQDKNALRMRTGVAIASFTWAIDGFKERVIEKNCIKPECSIHKQLISLGWEVLEDAAICKTSNMQNVRANVVSGLTSASCDKGQVSKTAKHARSLPAISISKWRTTNEISPHSSASHQAVRRFVQALIFG